MRDLEDERSNKMKQKMQPQMNTVKAQIIDGDNTKELQGKTRENGR